MGVIGWIREKIGMLFNRNNTEQAFDTRTYLSSYMMDAIDLWKQLEGSDGLKPPWVNEDVKTVQFSNTIARELASLVTQNINVQIASGTMDSVRVGEIQQIVDRDFLAKAQETIEDVIRIGGVMAKWNGSGIEYPRPDRFEITDYESDGTVTGCIFWDFYKEGEKYYKRAEWHRFENARTKNEETGEMEPVRWYKISNRAFVSDSEDELGRQIDLKKTKWADIVPEVKPIENLQKPLFTYLRTPYSNTVDTDSPLGVSVFGECIEELRWLDEAMSNMGIEVEDSKPVMFVSQNAIEYATHQGIKLPRYLQGLEMGIDADSAIQQWTPQLQAEARKANINFLLSIISYKCGFDSNYFSFDGNAINVQTATAVEAAEQRTVNTVKSYRNLLDRPNSNGDGRVGFIHDLVYIIEAAAILNNDENVEDFQLLNIELPKTYSSLEDITANAQEDAQFAYQLTQNGYYSKKYFLVKYMGHTEEEAAAILAEARAETKAETGGGLFGEE
jgi:A118 family predicted phage portal protein